MIRKFILFLFIFIPALILNRSVSADTCENRNGVYYFNGQLVSEDCRNYFKAEEGYTQKIEKVRSIPVVQTVTIFISAIPSSPRIVTPSLIPSQVISKGPSLKPMPTTSIKKQRKNFSLFGLISAYIQGLISYIKSIFKSIPPPGAM